MVEGAMAAEGLQPKEVGGGAGRWEAKVGGGGGKWSWGGGRWEVEGGRRKREAGVGGGAGDGK